MGGSYHAAMGFPSGKITTASVVSAVNPPAGRISILEKLRAQATSSKFQTPSSKEARSTKLKDRPARYLRRHRFLVFEL